ncbi:MAG: alpha/beta fold hydrolase [Bacteroidota bacterium]
MKSVKIQFENHRGEQLSARLELPVDSHPHAYALFAHCFTCNKNLTAVRNICRALVRQGIAVLRFDFTGLGESEGDFADTGFSSNVKDLEAAAHFLEQSYEAPSLLIGHSLGGAAVLSAAGRLSGIKAVATIGAPYDPEHVTHLFEEDLETIVAQGEAKVNIGGRSFRIKKEFLDDVETVHAHGVIHQLQRPLLVLHSPQDEVVEVSNATQIYKAAVHPKSYVSLDEADHMLTRKADSNYTGHMIAAWVSRYIPAPPPKQLRSNMQVVAQLDAEDGYTTEIKAGNHALTADEPESVGGNDFGPNPYELLSSALGACTTMTLRMYASSKAWDLQQVRVHIDHNKKYVEDWEASEEKPVKVDQFDRVIELSGDLDAAQRARLLEIADRCPVHRTLHETVQIKTSLKD